MTEQNEKYTKALDRLEEFLETHTTDGTFNSINNKFKEQNPDVDFKVFGMLKELEKTGSVYIIHQSAGTVGKFMFSKRHPLGHYEQGLIDEQKEKDAEEHKKRERENIEASIRVADSVITTNENIRINKLGKYALYVAIASVIISAIGLFKPDESKSDIIKIYESQIRMQKEIDSIKNIKTVIPSVNPDKNAHK